MLLKRFLAMNLASSRKLILSSGLSLIGLALFIGLAVFPFIGKITKASQEYLANQEILAELDQRESLSKQLEKEYQQKETDLRNLDKVFLSAEETVGFISNLEAIARKTDNFFEIKSVSADDSSNNKESSLNFRISLWGNFSSLLLFLANLENSPYPPYRLVEIEDMVIRRLTAESLNKFDFPLEEGDLESILSVRIYTQ